MEFVYDNLGFCVFIFFAGVLFGSFIMALMAGAGQADTEDMWREKLMYEIDSHKGTQKMLDEIKIKCIEKGVVL